MERVIGIIQSPLEPEFHPEDHQERTSCLLIHPILTAIQEAVVGSRFESDLWLVGGAVRDSLLGLPTQEDFDLVTTGSASELAELLFGKRLSTLAPVTYERFGTAMVRIGGADIEIVTARKESYERRSRKPTVMAATYEEDAARRDFTVNTLMRSLETGELRDPLEIGLADLENGILRTPLDPIATFRDDPLRMLRAVRFRWRFGFEPVPELLAAIKICAPRLEIISAERIRDELIKTIQLPDADRALGDLMDLGLIAHFAPELLPMVGCEQGKYHHLDVWNHTLLVVKNCGPGDLILLLSALLHDVGKPATRSVDPEGNIRFFSHETVGQEIATQLLRNLKFSTKQVQEVTQLVRNHMRLGSAPTFSPAAARRVIRDLGDQTDQLLRLVEADTLALKPGVQVMDIIQIRHQIDQVIQATPAATLGSPLDGKTIMALTGLSAGREIGKIKTRLIEMVLDGQLAPGDRDAAILAVINFNSAALHTPSVGCNGSEPGKVGK